MRIAVVGTSNSLRKDGYVPRLESDPRVYSVANYSIGASTGLHSVYRTSSIDFAAHDFCLIDFSVNEEVIYRNGGLNLELTREVVESLIVRCLASRCLPVITLLPRAIDTNRAAMRRFYRAIAGDLNLPVFDGYDLVDRLRAADDIPKPALFLDSAHIRPWVSATFARTLVDGLERLPPLDARFECQSLEASKFALVNAIDHLASVASVTCVTRSSNRASGEFVRTEAPRRFELSGLGGREAVGVCLNLRETNCFLHVAGDVADDDVVFDVRSRYFQSSALRFIISALPLARSVPISQGRLVIEALNDEGASERRTADSIQGELGRTTSAASGHLEIAGVFIKLNGVIASPFRSAPGNKIDLLQTSLDRTIEFAADLFRSISPAENDALYIEENLQRKKNKNNKKASASLLNRRKLRHAELRDNRVEKSSIPKPA